MDGTLPHLELGNDREVAAFHTVTTIICRFYCSGGKPTSCRLQVPIHNIWIQFFILEEVSKSLHRDAGLDYVRYEHGQHSQREPQDIEEGESHKCFVSCQSFIWIVQVG